MRRPPLLGNRSQCALTPQHAQVAAVSEPPQLSAYTQEGIHEPSQASGQGHTCSGCPAHFLGAHPTQHDGQSRVAAQFCAKETVSQDVTGRVPSRMLEAGD